MNLKAIKQWVNDKLSSQTKTLTERNQQLINDLNDLKKQIIHKNKELEYL